jgi:hypothetical protein
MSFAISAALGSVAMTRMETKNGIWPPMLMHGKLRSESEEFSFQYYALLNCMHSLQMATSFKETLDGWNIMTMYWLRRIAYDRVPKNYRTASTYLLSAVWHGFFLGIYFFGFHVHSTLDHKTIGNSSINYVFRQWISQCLTMVITVWIDLYVELKLGLFFEPKFKASSAEFNVKKTYRSLWSSWSTPFLNLNIKLLILSVSFRLLFDIPNWRSGHSRGPNGSSLCSPSFPNGFVAQPCLRCHHLCGNQVCIDVHHIPIRLHAHNARPCSIQVCNLQSN